jgi:tetratricopeptide (TPR) repeat protein
MRRAARALFAAALLFSAGCLDKPTEHRVRANAYLRGGDPEKALVEIEAGLAREARDVALLVLKGKALFELDRLDDARGAYLDALDAGKDEPPRALGEAHLGLAMIATRKQDWPEARQRFQVLVEIDARDADARINLARVCLQASDLGCAVQHGEEAGRLRGNSEEVLFTLGRIYVVAKQYDDAEKTFEHICEVVPGAASCPYGVALVAAQRGQRDRALAKLGEAVQKKLPNPDKLASDPLLAPLADDPAFKDLAARAAN